MLISSLVVDQVAISKGGGRVYRKLLQFNDDIWVALREWGEGPDLGGGVHALSDDLDFTSMNFPAVEMVRDGRLFGCATMHSVAANTLYVVAIQEGFVVRYAEARLDRETVTFEHTVSPDFRLLHFAHHRRAGDFFYEVTLERSEDDYAAAVQDILSIPRPPGVLKRSREAVMKVVYEHPEKIVEIGRSMLSV